MQEISKALVAPNIPFKVAILISIKIHISYSLLSFLKSELRKMATEKTKMTPIKMIMIMMMIHPTMIKEIGTKTDQEMMSDTVIKTEKRGMIVRKIGIAIATGIKKEGIEKIGTSLQGAGQEVKIRRIEEINMSPAIQGLQFQSN